MQTIVAFFASGSGRRLIAFVVGLIALLLNKKLGIELTEETQLEVTALVMAYMTQSAWREQAALKVETAGQAAQATVQALPADAKLAWLREQVAAEEARIASQKGPNP